MALEKYYIITFGFNSRFPQLPESESSLISISIENALIKLELYKAVASVTLAPPPDKVLVPIGWPRTVYETVSKLEFLLFSEEID